MALMFGVVHKFQDTGYRFNDAIVVVDQAYIFNADLLGCV